MLLSNYPYESKTKPSSVGTLLTWLEKKNSAFAGTCNYAVVYETGVLAPYIYAGCHGAVGRLTGVDAIAVEFQVKEGFCPSALFYKWYTEDSFIAPFILAKNDFGLVFSSDIPMAVLMSALIISRHPRELYGYKGRWKLFEYILEKGYSGDVAYNYSMNGNVSSADLSTTLSCPFGDYGGGHRAFFLMTPQELSAFQRQDFVTLSKKTEPFRTHPSIYGTYKLLREKEYAYPNPTPSYLWMGGDELEKEGREAISAYRKQVTQVEGYKPPNPFSKQARTIRPDEVTVNELIEVLLPLWKKKGIIS